MKSFEHYRDVEIADEPEVNSTTLNICSEEQPCQLQPQTLSNCVNVNFTGIIASKRAMFVKMYSSYDFIPDTYSLYWCSSSPPCPPVSCQDLEYSKDGVISDSTDISHWPEVISFYFGCWNTKFDCNLYGTIEFSWN